MPRVSWESRSVRMRNLRHHGKVVQVFDAAPGFALELLEPSWARHADILLEPKSTTSIGMISPVWTKLREAGAEAMRRALPLCANCSPGNRK